MEYGVSEVKGDQVLAKEYYQAVLGGEGRGKSRNLGNCGTGSQRTNKDHEDRDELEQLDEEKASPIP